MRLVRSITFTLAAALVSVDFFFQVDWAKDLLNLLCLLGLILSLPSLQRSTRLVVLGLLAAGASLFWWGGVGVKSWLPGFSDLSSLLAVILVVPVLGIPMRAGGYLDAINQWVSVTSTGERRLFVIFSVISYLTGSFIQASCISILWETMDSVAKRVATDPFRFMIAALPRSYSSCLVWAPTAPIMAACLYAAGSGWADIFPFALPISLALLLLNIALELATGGVGNARPKDELHDQDSASYGWRKKIAEFGLAFVAFIWAVRFIEGRGFSIVYVVPLLALVASATWSAAIGIIPAYLREVRAFFLEGVSGMGSQFALMVTAGFIGLAVKSSPLSDAASSVLSNIGGMGAKGLVPAVMTFIVGASAIGIHPFITIAIVGSCIAPGTMVSSRALALTLISASSIAFLVSPLSVTALLTSAVTGRSPLEVGLTRHWAYAVLASALSCILILAFA